MPRQTEFPGTALSNEDFKTFFHTKGSPNARYAWDCGVAIGKYLDGLRDGKLTGTRCDQCRRTVIPPRLHCEWCFRPMDAWVDLADTGRINTFSICHVSWDVQRLEKPQIPAVIEIDGASPGMGILHLVDEVDPQAVRIGMKVRAVWKPEGEREGAITDIRYFKPIG